MTDDFDAKYKGSLIQSIGTGLNQDCFLCESKDIYAAGNYTPEPNSISHRLLKKYLGTRAPKGMDTMLFFPFSLCQNCYGENKNTSEAIKWKLLKQIKERGGNRL